MPIYTLAHDQVVHANLDTCWRFFSDPRNLARITPAHLGFDIITDPLPDTIHPGLMIEYRVRPLLGIPIAWLTEITHVTEGRYFVDEQRVGPYAVWHHEHTFAPLDEGRTRCTDRVHYVPPFGPLGALIHPFAIRPQLDRIFEHRRRIIDSLFQPVARASKSA